LPRLQISYKQNYFISSSVAGLFGTQASITSDLAIIIQALVLILLLVGFRSGRKKTADSLSTHERLMKFVVLLNTASLIFVMVPSFVGGLDLVLAEIATIGFPLILLHHSLGLIAEALGIILVFKKFGSVRLWMKVTFTVWLITSVFGFAVYVIYYASPPSRARARA